MTINSYPFLNLTFAAFLCVAPNLSAWAEGVASWEKLKEATKGTFETEYLGYADGSEHESTRHFFASKLKLDWSIPLSDHLLLELVPSFRVDNADRTGSTWSFDEKDLVRPGATFETAVINYLGDDLSLSIGKQHLAWGKGDLYSPTDKLNPSDLLDLPGSEKLSVTSIAAEYLGRSFSTQWVVIPSFVPNRIPGRSNRWARSTAPLQAAATEALNFTPEIAIQPRRLPVDASDELQYGLQLTTSSMIPGWDFELSYFKGLDSEGVLERELAANELKLTRIFPKFEQWGLGFSTTAGDFEIHGEAAWHYTDVPDFDDDYLTYVLGGRYSFYNVELWQEVEEVSITLEYASEDILRDRTQGSAYLRTGFGRALKNAMLTRINFKFSEEAALEFNASYNLDDEGYSTQLKITHRPTDYLEFSGSLESFGGSADSFFGEWSNNDRFSFLMAYHF